MRREKWIIPDKRPNRDRDELETEENSMTGVVSQHVQDCIDHVDEYLGIDLTIAAMHVLPALTAMASDSII